MKIILITGASSGLGKAAAELLCKEYTVYGTSRFDRNGNLPYNMLKLNVIDNSSVINAVKHIIENEGRIDILVNNAGIGYSGSIEDMSMEEIQHQFDVNFFGAIRVIHAVLPYMRKQNSGLIINTSSLGGIVGLPFQGIYSASKFALEGITESLRLEVKQFNIKIVNINPGDFKTNITNARINSKKSIDWYSPYYIQTKKTLNIYINDELNGSNPVIFATMVYKIINLKNPKVRYYIGKISQKILVKLKFILPSKIFEKIVLSYCKVN